MPTQILTGSKGKWIVKNSPILKLNQVVEIYVTVTQDTCMEAEHIPVSFSTTRIEMFIPMQDFVLTESILRDYGT